MLICLQWRWTRRKRQDPRYTCRMHSRPQRTADRRTTTPPTQHTQLIPPMLLCRTALSLNPMPTSTLEAVQKKNHPSLPPKSSIRQTDIPVPSFRSQHQLPTQPHPIRPPISVPSQRGLHQSSSNVSSRNPRSSSSKSTAKCRPMRPTSRPNF